MMDSADSTNSLTQEQARQEDETSLRRATNGGATTNQGRHLVTSSGTPTSSDVAPPPPNNSSTSTQAQIPASVILLATAVTVFEYLGYRCEVFACVYNAFAPPNDRRYYYAPPLAVVRSSDSNGTPDTRLVKLVGEFYKVSLLSEFDPPAVHRMALAALESVLPAVELAALKPTNVRPLPVAKVSWRVVDPLPLEQLGITFYNSCVPALTTGCRFPLEVMVNSEAMARQMCARFTRLTLMARLTFYARTVPNATAAAAISAYRAAMSSSSSSIDTAASKTVMITTIDLLRSNAWKALSDRAEARPGGALPAVKLEPGLVKTEPGLSKKTGAGKTGAGKTGLMDDLVGFLAAEKLAFVAQVVRMYDEFCREIGARPALRMVEGSTAYNKLRELVAKHVTAASRRHVLWENAQVASPADLLSHPPCLLQGVDMCQAQLARALNELFVRVSDVFRFDVQAALNHRWNVWGWPEAMSTVTTTAATWTPAELQRELRERCGIWVEFLGEPARIVPVKFEVVALSLAGLMPNGRERNIGCLHTAPVPPTTATTTGAAVPTTTAAASAAATGPVFPDDGRRVHREVQLTHPMKDDDDDAVAALVAPAKRRRAEDDDDEMEEEKDEKEPEAKRRCEREAESEELKELRAQVRFLTEELGRLEREVGGRRETSSTSTTTS